VLSSGEKCDIPSADTVKLTGLSIVATGKRESFVTVKSPLHFAEHSLMIGVNAL
jgi:hypothetical protein